MTVTQATTMQSAQFYADCKKCENRKVKSDGSSMCIVKHIDCSVRSGQRPCSHFKGFEPIEQEREYIVTLTAVAVQRVTATSKDKAAKKADWCSADVDDWEVSEVQEA